MMPPDSDPLKHFITTSDSSSKWVRLGEFELQLVSQTWHGVEWRHRILLVNPSVNSCPGTCLLEITGDDAGQKDIDIAQDLANAAGMTVAVLFNVPAQPIWDRVEDDLIAHTFERFLETGDESWPLLFPMTKAVIQAMDAISQATATAKAPLERFVLTGASKRGWTTWLAGTVDDGRVIGIAPRVFDNLSFAAQLTKQMEDWGDFSPNITDYTSRNLPDFIGAPGGDRLVEMIDPHARLDNLTVPVLIVSGSNDPYWTVDSLNLFWHDIPGSKSLLIVPNAGHDLGQRSDWIPTVGAFAKSRFVDEEFAAINDGTDVPAGTTHFRTWRAESEDLNFTEAIWSLGVPGKTEEAAPATYVASFDEATISDHLGHYRVSSLVRVERSGKS